MDRDQVPNVDRQTDIILMVAMNAISLSNKRLSIVKEYDSIWVWRRDVEFDICIAGIFLCI
jgi:predicted membrane-bound spermidine synthase